MAQLSHSRRLSRLERMGESIGELHRQRKALEIRLSRKTRTLILEAHAAGLNNADIAGLIGEVTAEAIRQQAEAIGSVNPRALKGRRRAPTTPQDPSSPDPN